MNDIINEWAKVEGFDTFVLDHSAVMRNLGKYIKAAHEREVEGLKSVLYEARAWIQNAIGMDKNLCAARTMPLIDAALATSGISREALIPRDKLEALTASGSGEAMQKAERQLAEWNMVLEGFNAVKNAADETIARLQHFHSVPYKPTAPEPKVK